MSELQVGADCCAQLHALRTVLDETLYNNKRYLTVIRLGEIERAEMANQIAHLQKTVRRLEATGAGLMETVGVMCG